MLKKKLFFIIVSSLFCITLGFCNEKERVIIEKGAKAITETTAYFKSEIVKKISEASTDEEAKEMFINYLKTLADTLKQGIISPEGKKTQKLMENSIKILEQDKTWNSSRENLLKICNKVDEVNSILKRGKIPQVVANSEVQENGILGGILGGIVGAMMVGIPGSLIFWHLRETEGNCLIEQPEKGNCAHFYAAVNTFFGSIICGITGAIVGAIMIPL